MIFMFRNASQILLVATFFCLFSYHVGAHCFHPDGSVDHVIFGCHPTISPAPTESPAPSPSPSTTPTTTQTPSHSMLPSSSPTAAPTTSNPTTNPTDSPTESPAPSPSPSAFPTASPSNSAAPSMNPTDLPSVFPSQNPSFVPTTSSPSDSPTGSILLTVLDVEFTMQNITREREMSPLNVKYFERETALYLQNQVQHAPGVFKIEVENVVVKNQNLVVEDNRDRNFGNGPLLRKQRRLYESQTYLIITIDVVVSVVLNRSEDLKLNVFFEEFFEMPEHKNKLRGMLEHEKNFAQESFIEGATSSSNASVKKASNGTAVTGTVLGVVTLIIGSGLLWMWIQTRRAAVIQSNRSGKIENLGTVSKSFESDDGRVTMSSANCKREIDDADAIDQLCHIESDNNENGKLTHLMYIPTLMPTESNIEVPDTPVTAFAVNGFATPVSANGFFTPASTKSKGGDDNSTIVLPKLLGEISSNHEVHPAKILKESTSSKSKKQKFPLPPKILGPLKSPFRREKKASDKVENQEYDSSSMSGVGVVAGKNNACSSEDREMKTTKVEIGYSHTQKVLRDLPLEIGRPSTAHFEAKSTVVPVEEDIVVRPNTGRKNKKDYRGSRPCPPLVIGGPSNAGLRAAKSAKRKNHGVVDIVDEIAYLYSKKSEPERYEDDTLNQ